jgi:hypothetical protein
VTPKSTQVGILEKVNYILRSSPNRIEKERDKSRTKVTYGAGVFPEDFAVL